MALTKAKRVVVKVGTNALTGATARLHRPHLERLANELLAVAQTRELIVVSSGAIAFGVELLGLSARPKDVVGKQACAAVGQSRLMRAWEEALAPKIVAQVLLTRADPAHAAAVLARLPQAHHHERARCLTVEETCGGLEPMQANLHIYAPPSGTPQRAVLLLGSG